MSSEQQSLASGPPPTSFWEEITNHLKMRILKSTSGETYLLFVSMIKQEQKIYFGLITLESHVQNPIFYWGSKTDSESHLVDLDLLCSLVKLESCDELGEKFTIKLTYHTIVLEKDSIPVELERRYLAKQLASLQALVHCELPKIAQKVTGYNLLNDADLDVFATPSDAELIQLSMHDIGCKVPLNRVPLNYSWPNRTIDPKLLKFHVQIVDSNKEMKPLETIGSRSMSTCYLNLNNPILKPKSEPVFKLCIEATTQLACFKQEVTGYSTGAYAITLPDQWRECNKLSVTFKMNKEKMQKSSTLIVPYIKLQD